MGSFGNQTAAPPKEPMGAEAQVIVRQVTVATRGGSTLQLGPTFWLSDAIPPGFEQYRASVVGLSTMDAQTRADMASFLGSAVDTATIPSGCKQGADAGPCLVGDGERSLYTVPSKLAAGVRAVALLRNADSLFVSSCELPMPAASRRSPVATIGHCRPGSNDWHLALPSPAPVHLQSASPTSHRRPIACNWTTAAPTNIPDAPSRTCTSVLPSGAVFLLSNPARASKSRLPLTIAVAKDGKNFDQAWAIRRDAPPARYYRKCLSGQSRDYLVEWCCLYAVGSLLRCTGRRVQVTKPGVPF